MGPSDVIAAVALLVAIVSLGWQFVRSRWDRPIVIVDGEIREMWGGEEDEDVVAHEMHLNMVNVGEKPATVILAGWALDPDPEFESDKDETLGPWRIDAHDHVELVDNRNMSWPWPSNTAVPYVRVVLRPTWWERRRGVQPIHEVRGHPVDVTYIRNRSQLG